MGSIGKLQLIDLDGLYDVTMSSDQPLPEGFFEHMSANVNIKDGVLVGSDVGGSAWNATFTLLNGDVFF